MTVRVEKAGAVWTVIHSRPEAKNAMDPSSAEALVEAFLAFDRDPEAAVAVLWGEGGAFCAGFDLKHAAGNGSALNGLEYAEGSDGTLPRGPMGPTRLELDKPVIAAMFDTSSCTFFSSVKSSSIMTYLREPRHLYNKCDTTSTAALAGGC